MKITWLGHAAFLLETGGLRILTDPYDASDSRIYYRPITISADIVTISHNHFDHNHVAGLTGNPKVVKRVEKKTVRGVNFIGISSYHDNTKGSERGENTIFVIMAERLCICHAGDLGHLLSTDQIKAIGQTDILLVPV